MTSRTLLLRFGLSFAGSIALFACGSSGGTPDAAPAVDANHSKPDAGVDASAKRDAASEASDAKKDTMSAADAADDADAGDAGIDVTDAPFDATGFAPIDGGSAVITQVVPETWTWVPFPESKCRDGSTTGIGVNFNPASQNLVIYMEGGGACFNFETCVGNPSSFGAADFPMRFPSASDGGTPESGNGILDRTNAANPVADWNFIYVPYCTGDIHAGNNPAGTVLDVTGPQMFVGYQNVNLFLERIVPTFATAKQVLLTGVSGGGFGAAANYAHVQRAFGAVPVDMLDDSGPFMEDPYLPLCLQNEVRTLWGLDSTVGADCEGQCNDPGTFFVDLARHISTKYPARTFGLMDSVDDGTISEFFGFGAADCTSFVQESATTFGDGLNDIRTKLAAEHNLGTFYFPGTDHTSLGDDSFYQRDTTSLDGGAGVLLTSWVGSLVHGTTYNAGP
jgi:hypothetical protein